MSAGAIAKHAFVATLRERWLTRRNEFIGAAGRGKSLPGRIFDGPDDYARRELRAYRLAQVWARDESLPGEWYWVRRDQRWDVYPQREPCTLMRVTKDGPWHTFFYPDGTKARTTYILARRARAACERES